MAKENLQLMHECCNKYKVLDRQIFCQSKDNLVSRKKQVPFSMAIENVVLMHEECCPNYMWMGTLRRKEDG